MTAGSGEAMRQEGMSRGLDDSAVGPAEDRVGDPAPGGQTPDVPAGQPGAGLIGALIEVQQRGLWIVAWEQRLTPPRRSLGDRRRRRGLPTGRRRPHGHPCRELMRKLLGQPRPLDRNAGEFPIPNRTDCRAFLSTGWCRGTGKRTAASSKRPYRCRVNGTCRWSPLTQPPAPSSPRLGPAPVGGHDRRRGRLSQR
jgi:hypothetical protein